VTARWGAREATFRGVWEAMCKVEGCPNITRLEGPWSEDPRSPRFFRTTASSVTGELPGGWLYVDQQYLENRFALCPDHAPTWVAHCDSVGKWDAENRAQRKSWWQAFMSRFTGSTSSPCPVSPFQRKAT